MHITLVGAGNLATSLGHALQEAGHTVGMVWSRTEASARALGERLGCAWTTRLADVEGTADVLIACVKDSCLQEVAMQLPQDAFVVHTAGSMPMDVLPQRRRGVLYPMQTFSRERTVPFSDIPVFIECSTESGLRALQALAGSLSRSVLPLDSDRRSRLHVAAVFACNFANHCYQLAAEVLEAQGIPFSSMLPLIDETARKVHSLTPREAQTGPAVRWDENVMQRHLLMLDDRQQAIYKAMSDSIHRRAEEGGKRQDLT